MLEVYVEVVAAAILVVVVAVNCNSMRKRQRAITASQRLKSLDNFYYWQQVAKWCKLLRPH